jgi:uncharacterized membrane protein
VSADAGGLERLEDLIELALKIGLALSTALLVIGLVVGLDVCLRAGIVLLMLTPVVRVAVVMVGLAVERDWLFTAVCLFVLAVLASGMWVAVHR